MTQPSLTTPPAAESGRGTLGELFGVTVSRHPDMPCFTDEGDTRTYREVDELANAVAARLRDHGIGAEDRVAVHLPRSVDLLVALVGVIKAGAAYVAVDVRYPPSRRDLMLRESGARAVITDAAGAGRLPELPGVEILVAIAGAGDRRREPPLPLAGPASAAAVLFTSGSSGVPKAIVLEHRNLVSFAANSALPALRAGERVGQISNISFDAFHYELWSGIAHGAEIVVLAPIAELLAAGFGPRLRERRIDAMLLPTAAANTVMREDPQALSGLRVLLTGGDVLAPASCRALLDSGFEGTLFNLYGPSEATTACTCHRVDQVEAGETAIPIGRPLAGTTVHILDDGGRPVRPGETGELHVSGAGVSRGYLDRPDLTERSFRPDPSDPDGGLRYATGDLVRERPDGALEFAGRADDQVKILGYRVEPGEVERTLLRLPGVADAAVVPTGPEGDRRLTALVVRDPSAGDVDEHGLRGLAAEHLPHFMVPARIAVLPAIPVNEHGKRDRTALAELAAEAETAGRTQVPPRTGTQRYLADLWHELLDIPEIGATDDFFALGGNSLLAFSTERRVSQDLGVSVGFRCILDNPVLQDLAAAIDTAAAATPLDAPHPGLS